MSQHLNGQVCLVALPAGGYLPSHFRLVSLIRLPAPKGKGIYNEAEIYHDEASFRVSWHSNSVDTRLKRGCIVSVKAPRTNALTGNGCLPIAHLDLVDKPLASVNLFQMVPPTWGCDRQTALLAASLWDQLSRPFQHLCNAVLWEGGRFYRFITGPVSSSDYHWLSGSNFRQVVETAEIATNLARGLPDVSVSVVTTAALLHEAGKADDFRLAPDREGYVLSERGLKVGYQHTILEWLAVARCQVIMPDAQYLALIHALIAARGSAVNGRSIEASILAVVKRMGRAGENAGYRNSFRAESFEFR